MKTSMRALCVGVLLTLATPTLAATPQEEAQQLFDEGRALMKEGKYADACPKFEKSLSLDPALGTELNLADCYEKLGKTASAWSTFTSCADHAKANGAADREKFARDRAKSIEPKLMKLSIEASKQPGLVVKRDDIVVGEGLWGVAVPVDPGKHTVTASAPGKKSWGTTVSLGDEGKTVVLKVPLLLK